MIFLTLRNSVHDTSKKDGKKKMAADSSYEPAMYAAVLEHVTSTETRSVVHTNTLMSLPNVTQITNNLLNVSIK